MTTTEGLTATKAFKAWEKRFSQKQIAQKRRELGLGRPSVEARIATITHWTHGYAHFPTNKSKWAVYEAQGAESWQLFRCALKGLSTQHKLYFLDDRWFLTGAGAGCLDADYRETDDVLSYIEYIRIMNYIGALRRGGQLNEQFRIVR